MVLTIMKKVPASAALLLCAADLLLALCCAGERHLPPHLTRPPDIRTEWLEQPRPEQDRLAGEQPTASVRQTGATTLAKAATKKSWEEQSTIMT
jgi:hypothetical protein